MTLRQTVQAAPGKTSDLIKQLSETSNQAVKTREGLFAQLGAELNRYVEIEEQLFLPLLRKHDDTKALVPDALKGNKDLRASLEKLNAMPKDTDAFLDELDVLNKSFQQHIRNERKELLPAVLKAFSTEEASDLAASIDVAVADADKAKRDEKREEAAKAKRDAEKAESDAMAKRDKEKAEADANAKREAAQAERDAEKAKVAAKDKREAAKAKRDSKKAEQAAAVKRAATDEKQTTSNQKAETAAQEVIALNNQTSQSVREDLQAVAASSTVSLGAAKNIYAIWMDYVSNAVRINTAASRQIMQCKSIPEAADLQREFATSSLLNKVHRNAQAMKIALGRSTIGARPD